uniref:Candidate secreted effector n=1 Tax=Meloidogyne incognita TaxID=6306 RepID=A0A914M6D9_MELIC
MSLIGNNVFIAFLLFVIFCEFDVESSGGGSRHRVQAITTETLQQEIHALRNGYHQAILANAIDVLQTMLGQARGLQEQYALVQGIDPDRYQKNWIK